MFEEKLNQIEHMLGDLIRSVGTLKAYFEEEKEENQRRFAQIDKRFEQIDERFAQIDKRFEQIDERFEQMDERFKKVDQRFDEVIHELRSNKTEHDYMATRLFRAEMEIDRLTKQVAKMS